MAIVCFKFKIKTIKISLRDCMDGSSTTEKFNYHRNYANCVISIHSGISTKCICPEEISCTGSIYPLIFFLALYIYLLTIN